MEIGPGIAQIGHFEGRDFRIGLSSFRWLGPDRARHPDDGGQVGHGPGAAAEAAGRHPDQLSLVVRANVHHSLVPLGADRPKYHGSVDRIAADVRGALEIGARQVILGLQASKREVAEYLDLADAITGAARVGVAA